MSPHSIDTSVLLRLVKGWKVHHSYIIVAFRPPLPSEPASPSPSIFDANVDQQTYWFIFRLSDSALLVLSLLPTGLFPLLAWYLSHADGSIYWSRGLVPTLDGYVLWWAAPRSVTNVVHTSTVSKDGDVRMVLWFLSEDL